MNRPRTMSSASEVDRAAGRDSALRSGSELVLQTINRLMCGLLVFNALAVINGCNYFLGSGQLRTVSVEANRLLSIVIFLLPAIILLAHLTTSSTFKWWIVTGLFLLALPSALLALFFLISEPQKQLQSIQISNQSISCFRTPGGGFDSYAIEVRQERRIAPGLIWSTLIDREDFTKDVAAKLLDGHHLQCKFFTHERFVSESLPRTRTVVLRIR